jgi:hypothetical protein
MGIQNQQSICEMYRQRQRLWSSNIFTKDTFGFIHLLLSSSNVSTVKRPCLERQQTHRNLPW